MKYSHREDKRGDRIFDILTGDEEGVRLTISRLGAELISVARRNKAGDWIGFLHRDNELTPPATGWANHATVMGYYLHRLKNERTLYRGREMRGGTHGFLRTKTWRIALSAVPKDAITYQIGPEDFSEIEYPLKVSLDLTYRLESDKVRVTFAFKNQEIELAAHVGFGLHPGFAATSSDSFRFQMPAGVYRRHFSPDNYLSGETEDIRFDGGEMPFAREALPGSYILELFDVPERRFTFLDPPSGRTVVLDLDGVPYLTLWSDGGAFLCVEPCWGLTDHHDQRAFENKEGIQSIPPGGELAAAVSMQPMLDLERN